MFSALFADPRLTPLNLARQILELHPPNSGEGRLVKIAASGSTGLNSTFNLTFGRDTKTESHCLRISLRAASCFSP